MKTQPLLKIFKFSTLVSLGIAGANAFVAQPICAQSPENIVITENSSTSLTATLNGSSSGVTITPNGPDNWSITFPSHVFSLVTTSFFWGEPFFFPSQVNSVAVGTVSDSLVIQSDIPFNGDPRFLFDNGTVVLGVGTDLATNENVNVQFIDNGDATHGVPDIASTASLLSLSLIGLFVASRFRSFRLA